MSGNHLLHKSMVANSVMSSSQVHRVEQLPVEALHADVKLWMNRK